MESATQYADALNSQVSTRIAAKNLERVKLLHSIQSQIIGWLHNISAQTEISMQLLLI